MTDPNRPKISAYARPPSKEAHPGFPLLPETRPRRLSVVIPETSFMNGAFFQKLPPEIRQQVYLAAFGGRRLHLELGYRRQPTTKHENDQEGPDNEPRRWEWWSCVCHSSEVYQYARKSFLNSWLCACLRGRRRGEHSISDQIGVMGWLQSCRQAYLETIGILYGSNSIVLGSIDIANQMDRLFLPQRLQSITCLELYFSYEFWVRTRKFNEHAGWRAIHHAMRLVTPPRFPQLRDLTMMVDGILAVALRMAAENGELSDDVQEAVKDQILRPCDCLVEMYGATLRSFAFCVPERAYLISRPWLQASKSVGEEKSDAYGRKQLWRPVPAPLRSTAAAGEGLELEASLKKNLSQTSEIGYWIRCSDPLPLRDGSDWRQMTPDFLSDH